MTIEDWFQVLAEAADLMLKKKISPGLGSGEDQDEDAQP